MNGFYWIASYPKSGNTWLRLLLASLRAGGAPVTLDGPLAAFAPRVGTALNFETHLCVDPTECSTDELANLFPALVAELARIRPEPQFSKVHDAWGLTPSGQPLFPARFTLGSVYVVRDPRDVAVSLAHHHGQDVDQAIAVMARQTAAANSSRCYPGHIEQKIGTWSHHVASWLDSQPPPLLVRYESLRADPRAELARVAAHCGLEAGDHALDGAVAATRFSTLQALEEHTVFDMGQAAGSRFFRQGVAGGWRQSLTAAQVASIERDHGVMMARLGYR